MRSGRRDFLKGGLALAGTLSASAVQAAEPITRNGQNHLKLSLAAYSFNKQLPRRAPMADQAKAEMRLEDFVQFCADQNLDGCEPTSYYFPKKVTREYLLKLKEQTFRLGLDVSGTAIGNDFCLPEGPARQEQLAMCREWIEHAAFLGAPVIRIFAGKTPKGDTEEAAVERCVEGINESLDYAAQHGVFLALENHGGITATPKQIMKIIKAVKPSPWFGVNFDSGNFATKTPYEDLAQIAPYAVNAQIKVNIRPEGNPIRADFPHIIQLLKDADYRGYIVLEYEEKEPFKNIPPLLEELRALL